MNWVFYNIKFLSLCMCLLNTDRFLFKWHLCLLIDDSMEVITCLSKSATLTQIANTSTYCLKGFAHSESYLNAKWLLLMLLYKVHDVNSKIKDAFFLATEPYAPPPPSLKRIYNFWRRENWFLQLWGVGEIYTCVDLHITMGYYAYEIFLPLLNLTFF